MRLRHRVSSMATEMIKGKPIANALALTNKDVVGALDDMPAHKLHCSVLLGSYPSCRAGLL